MKKITMETVAKIAGVSKATVSRVLNGAEEGVGSETRQRVLNVAKEMNYALDASKVISAAHCKNVALIIPDITNPFFADIAKAVERRARREGYSVMISNTDFCEEEELQCLHELVTKDIDGIILISSGFCAKSEHLLPFQCGVPMVLLDRKLKGTPQYLNVTSNNEYAAVISCEKLIKNGDSRIAFISGPLNISTSEERLEGYKAALAQYGIPFDNALLTYGDYTVESGYNAVLSMERSGVKFSAILAANDLTALGALRALKELSYRVPEDVEIIGFDNIVFSQYCDPPLSTIQQPTAEMGLRAAELLFCMIDGHLPAQPVPLTPRLLLRKTTK